MSSNAKRVPEVNLEDFERRLRAAGSAQGAVEDPLEELTRLVNTISTERPRSEERAPEVQPERPARVLPPMRPANLDEPEYTPPPAHQRTLREEMFDGREDAGEAPEAPLLRPSFDEADPDVSALPPIRPEPQVAAAATASGRKPSWYFKIGGIGAVALAMAGGAVYLNMHRSHVGVAGAPPMIMAAEGPSKVAPPDEKTVQSSSDSGALLNKDSTGAGAVKIVSHQEQPIDMSLKGDSPVALTKDSPIIAPSGGVVMIQPATPSASAPAPEPAPSPPAAAPPVQKKGPKNVAVRPDGTLITADAAAAEPPAAVPPPAAAPTPRKADAGPSVTTQPSSPTLDLPPPRPAKTTARVSVAKTDTTGPTDPVNAPLQLGAPSAAEKPQKIPTKLRPPENADTQAAAAAPAGGDWAVQFAAPRSEADAQSAIQKLQTKYASALGDSELVTRKADVNGETIYRVRATGLSRADAAALCQRVKADGGDCFPTRN